MGKFKRSRSTSRLLKPVPTKPLYNWLRQPGPRHGHPISGGQVMHLTGLIKRSGLTVDHQHELLDQLAGMYPYEVPDLIVYLEEHQLDLTQLMNYTKADIDKRLDHVMTAERL
jgi:hypothetical protein